MPERSETSCAPRRKKKEKKENTKENEGGDRRDSNLVQREDVVRCALCHSETSLPLFRTSLARSASPLSSVLISGSINPYVTFEACNNGTKFKEVLRLVRVRFILNILLFSRFNRQEFFQSGCL